MTAWEEAGSFQLAEACDAHLQEGKPQDNRSTGTHKSIKRCQLPGVQICSSNAVPSQTEYAWPLHDQQNPGTVCKPEWQTNLQHINIMPSSLNAGDHACMNSDGRWGSAML